MDQFGDGSVVMVGKRCGEIARGRQPKEAKQAKWPAVAAILIQTGLDERRSQA
jgi:hypothetical protein